MSFLRWILSFPGFPLGGWAAFLLVGPAGNPLAAAAAGAIAGTAIGTAQWFALRPAVSPYWIAAGTIGMAVGSAAAATVTGSATSVPALAATGAITGAAVGLAQGLAFRQGPRTVALWSVTVSGAWALGWVTTANVIIDAGNGYVSFGASGALVVTALTGFALRRILGRRDGLAAAPAESAAVVDLPDAHSTPTHSSVPTPAAARPAAVGPAAGTQR
jgi:FtsH-binding integral membrane protein